MNTQSEAKNSMLPIKNFTKKESSLKMLESDSMSIVSHYIHNKGYKHSEIYEEKAKVLIKEIYAYDIDDKESEHITEDNVYYSLFDDFLSVPFLPIENHILLYVDPT